MANYQRASAIKNKSYRYRCGDCSHRDTLGDSMSNHNTQCNCPHCGRIVALVPVKQTAPVGYQPYNKLQSTPPWSGQGPSGDNEADEWYKMTPIDRLNPRDIYTALLDTTVTAGLSMAVVSGLAYYLHWPWQAIPTAGVLAACWRYFGGINMAHRLLQTVESWSRRDLDGDGHTGPPPAAAPAPRIGLEVIHKSDREEFKQMFRSDLPEDISPDDFLEFAQGVVLEKRGLAESAWCGQGKPFSKAKYSQLLESLTQAGLIRWRNEKSPAQGRELTGAGRRSLMQFVYKNARTRAQASNGGDNYDLDSEVGQ